MSNIKVTEEFIQEQWENSELKLEVVFDKCLIVACKLPNGFTLVESSGCIDPANFDYEIGFESCRERIIDKMWLLYGFNKQCEVGEI